MDSIDYLSEKIELAALISMHECCPDDTRKTLGLDLVEVEDGMAACAGHDPSILINRVLGLGVDEKVSVEAIKQVEGIYDSRQIQNYFIHIYEDSLTHDAKDYLAGDHFVKKRGWMKFRNHRPAERSAETSLRVEKIAPERRDDFATIVCGAFGMSPQAIPLLAGLADDERWHLFVSYSDDQPAGAGALFAENETGWLEWGATDPAFRSRGSQAAIMAARLSLASDLGCEYVFTETGEEVEGDPQHSYKNILKAGFEESVLRMNFSPNRA